MSVVHVAGNPALDLVGTVAERGTTDLDELTDPTTLAQWFVDAGIVDRAPRVTTEDLRAAVRLREHLHALVTALVDGTAPPAAGRAALNRLARLPAPVPQLGPDGLVVRRGSAEACLAAVARAATELYDRDDGAVVRWCADDRCTHPFLDRSRNKQRRWCDMATCGDRAKVRRYRGRTT
jgi:predicted RNA-binding Zn ribbon-like protein